MLQSNWICKAFIPITRNHNTFIEEFSVPPGVLRAVGVQCLRGGQNARNVRFRVVGSNFVGGEYAAPFAGFDDWIMISPTGLMRDKGVVMMNVISKSKAIPVFVYGDANEDNHPVQLSFWYEPDDADDDSHLAPLAVTRGGQPT